jgi:hypothetical protein
MRRHVNIGQGIDLHDIARHDWPSVRTEIEANLYSSWNPYRLLPRTSPIWCA